MSQIVGQENLKEEQQDHHREENVVDNPLLGPVEVITANGDVTFGKKLFVDSDGKLTFVDKISFYYTLLIAFMFAVIMIPISMLCVFMVIIGVVAIWALIFTREIAMLSLLVLPCILTVPILVFGLIVFSGMVYSLFLLRKRFIVKFDDMNRKIIVQKILYFYFTSFGLKKTEVDYTNIRDFEVQLFSSKMQSNKANRFARVNIITKDTEDNKVPMSLHKNTEMVKSLCRELKDTMLEKLDVGSQTQAMY